MEEKTTYRLRLKLRVGKSLDEEGSALTASVAGRTVTIKSEKRGEPLSKASWLVMDCGAFETEAQAREFGEELRRATHLAGLVQPGGGGRWRPRRRPYDVVAQSQVLPKWESRPAAGT